MGLFLDSLYEEKKNAIEFDEAGQVLDLLEKAEEKPKKLELKAEPSNKEDGVK